MRTQTLRPIGISVLVGVAVIVLGWKFYGWMSEPSVSASTPPPVQTVARPSDPCDGIYRTYMVPSSRTIMPGIGVCRGIEWIVKEGRVGLFDKKGKELPDIITPGTPEDYRTPPAVEWRAVGNTARVHARLYH